MGGKPRIRLKLHREITRCTICAPHLPLGPRPVVQFSKTSRVVIVGQAPGTKVHESGFPWNDDSGDHLREWLGVDREVFYDAQHFAHVPMGFCYPGRRDAGDAPPRPECAPQWHGKIFEVIPEDAMVVLAGIYSHQYYLGKRRKKTMSDTVRAWRDYLPRFWVVPHPSWRSRLWIGDNPWFTRELLPELRRRVTASLQRSSEVVQRGPSGRHSTELKL